MLLGPAPSCFLAIEAGFAATLGTLGALSGAMKAMLACRAISWVEQARFEHTRQLTWCCTGINRKREDGMYNNGLTVNDGKLVESKRTGKVPWSVTMFLSLVVCAWLGSEVLSTAQSPDEGVPGKMRARQFVVVDDTGKERAEFGIMENGEAGMVVWNKKRSTAVSVGVDRTGMPRVTLENSKAEALLDFGILKDRFPAFVMRDASGRRRLGVMATEEERVAIALFDTDKTERCTVSLGRDGHPQIILKDAKGKARVSLMLDDNGTSALDLLSHQGKGRILFQVDALGQADAAIFGPDGQVTWSKAAP